MAKRVYLSEGLKDRLKQARLDLTPKRGGFVSQEVLAAEVGVSGATLGNWESGAYEPSLRLIEDIARVLGVTPTFLAFGVGEVSGNHGERLAAAPPVQMTKVSGGTRRKEKEA